MGHRKLFEAFGAAFLSLMTAAGPVAASDRALVGTKVHSAERPGDNRVVHKCLAPQMMQPPEWLNTSRVHPWSLPAEAAEIPDTVHVLILRFNFQYETTDDVNTTGRGRMNVNHITSSADSTAYYDTAGHWIDPPPHNKTYFNAHMRALNYYWHQVSEQKITLTWDIFPPDSESAYTLPHPMSYYGKCEEDSVVAGLERYFVDGIQLADTIQKSPDIDFSKYQSIILFHAGSDRQNDIGFPTTCSDLFTGFIKFGDSVAVDDSTHYVHEGLLMPETACQDGRATALNAVLAHEFGHQLGLVDLYDTRTFMSQLGDFSLMDNNGFGTGIDYGFKVGQVFGAIPVYPDAWSRAYLGLTPVTDYRNGTDVRTLAAEVLTHGDKIARLPISENEFYLVENRNYQTDPGVAVITVADSATGVILGPGVVEVNGAETTLVVNGEYDYLLPGSGMLIYLVDEGVAALDYRGDGQNNFDDNSLQWDYARKFVTLIEADGIVNFGGYYRSGYGRAEDMFCDDRNHSFTPNTNPQALDNSGNNTHIYVTDIRRDSEFVELSSEYARIDSLMYFKIETDNLVAGFPARAGRPIYGFSPVAADLDRDGTDEIIAVSGNNLLAITGKGENFLRKITGCLSCPLYYDTAKSSTSPGTLHAVPLFARVNQTITCGPAVGDFGGDTTVVAIGYPLDLTHGTVLTYKATDGNTDGQADLAGSAVTTRGYPVALSFGDRLYVLTDGGIVYRKSTLSGGATDSATIPSSDRLLQGMCRINRNLIVMAGDSVNTRLYYWGDSLYSYTISGHYSLGPIVTDLDRDGLPEVIMFSTDGRGAFVTVDTTTTHPGFSIMSSRNTGYSFAVNPVAGDVDADGYPDVLIGGTNMVYAFNKDLLLKLDFPIEVDDRFPEAKIVAPIVQGELDGANIPEVMFPMDNGNIWSLGLTKTYGFPLSGGEEGVGSCLVLHDSVGTKLAYLGADGWLYAWQMQGDTSKDFWPMGGHDAAATFALPTTALGDIRQIADDFPTNQFFNYPNPVVNGQTTIRYYLGREADRVGMKIFDLSGKRVAEMNGSVHQGENELTWDCGAITPGVYRCHIEVEFSGKSQTAFTDIAVIR